MAFVNAQQEKAKNVHEEHVWLGGACFEGVSLSFLKEAFKSKCCFAVVFNIGNAETNTRLPNYQTHPRNNHTDSCILLSIFYVPAAE